MSWIWSACPLPALSVPAPAPPSAEQSNSAGKSEAATGEWKWPEQAGVGAESSEENDVGVEGPLSLSELPVPSKLVVPGRTVLAVAPFLPPSR